MLMDKRRIESYEKTYLSFRESIQETRASTRGRLVWFVGIAGYAVLNGKTYWDAVGNQQFSGLNLALLSLPWIVSAFFSLITHFVVDEAGIRDDNFYYSKQAAIGLHKIAIEDGNAKPNEFIQIIDDTYPAYQDLKRDADRWSSRAKWLERFAFASLVIGFIWAAIGPFLLRTYAK